MLTMTRLPPDSFPSTGLHDSTSSSHSSSTRHLFLGIHSDAPSSVISPLTLPRGATGYFDNLTAATAASAAVSHTTTPLASSAANQQAPAANRANGKARLTSVYSPLSPGARGPPPSQPAQFFSPYLLPTAARDMPHELQQQRSLSLSPTARVASPHTGQPRSSVASPSSAMASRAYVDAAASDSHLAMPSINCPTSLSGHPRSVSADGASALSQAQMIRRLIQQNSRIREAWEAERKYMEANRERVEEVYKEERALMEEERVEWEEEKTALMQNIKSLEQQLLALGANHNQHRLPGARAAGVNGAGTAGLALRGGIGGIPEAMGQRAKSPSELAASPSAAPGVLPIAQRRGFAPNGGDASPAAAAFQPRSSAWGSAALSPVQAEFRVSSISERVTPSKQPESSPFFPQQPASIPIPPSSTESMASSDRDDSGPIPVVDIQEIHPELEGIPIKAPTIQKTTFTDKPASPTAKPVSHSSSSSPPPAPDAAKSSKSRRAGRDQTLQALAADESDRLVLHAGHTPNHSLSLLPTAPLSQATTASSSGGSTPKQQPGDEDETLVPADPNPASQQVGQGPASESPKASPPRREAETAAEDHPEPLLEPTEDITLRGPLMVRNMPAHDEIFFRKLSDKLEEVSKDSEASVPAVLRVAACAPEEAGEPEKEKQENNNNVQAGTDVDGAPATAGSEGSEKDKGSDDESLEIPLKLKKSNNFGAPFGEFR